MVKRIVLLFAFASTCLLFGCVNPVDKQAKSNPNEKTGIDTVKMLMDIINNSDASSMSNMFFDMVSSKLENNEVIYTCKPNNNYIKVDNIRKNRELQKRSLINRLELQKSQNKPFADFLKILVNNDIRLKYVYQDKTDTDTCQVILSTDDIKQVLSADGQLTIDGFKTEIKSVQIHLPLQLDELTIWHDYSIVGNNVTYLYEIDESVASMDYVIDNYDLMRSYLSDQLFGVNDGFVLQAKELGLGMNYVYFGSITNKRMEVLFKNEELH